jgi:hypothetical protein
MEKARSGSASVSSSGSGSGAGCRVRNGPGSHQQPHRASIRKTPAVPTSFPRQATPSERDDDVDCVQVRANQFNPLDELRKSNQRVEALLRDYEDDTSSTNGISAFGHNGNMSAAEYFKFQLQTLDKSVLAARVGNDDGLDALGKELQSMIVTDSLLNENSQETGTIVEVLERGELEITRTMQNERMESVKRFILGLICRSLICS